MRPLGRGRFGGGGWAWTTVDQLKEDGLKGMGSRLLFMYSSRRPDSGNFLGLWWDEELHCVV